jgi:hypothetical protein
MPRFNNSIRLTRDALQGLRSGLARRQSWSKWLLLLLKATLTMSRDSWTPFTTFSKRKIALRWCQRCLLHIDRATAFGKRFQAISTLRVVIRINLAAVAASVGRGAFHNLRVLGAGHRTVVFPTVYHTLLRISCNCTNTCEFGLSP